MSPVGVGFDAPLPPMNGVPPLVCDARTMAWRSWTRSASLYASGSAGSLRKSRRSHANMRELYVTSAAGVGAGRGIALLRLRELGCFEGRAVKEVSFAHLELLQAVAVEELADDDGAGDDHRGAVGVQARQLSALGEREGCQALELALHR